MNSIVGAVNQAVIGSSFSSSSSLTSASAQEAILSKAYTPDTSGAGFTSDSTSESLTSVINTALNENSDMNLLTSLSNVGSYSATESLLQTVYDKSSALDKFV